MPESPEGLISSPDSEGLMPVTAPPAGASPNVLETCGIRKSFGAHQPEVLQGVDFTVARGEKVCILGPSGSGKTTFLRCLNLLVEPSAGTLRCEGRLIGDWTNPHGQRPSHVATYRRQFGMVFQHFELFPHLSALDNVSVAPRHVLRVPKEEALERGRELLKRVGLGRFERAKPAALSGGQRQRVAIARALAMNPVAILFDEPTSALDSEMVGEVLNLLFRLADDGLTMIIVTHELAFARDVSDRIVVMEHGRVIEEGPAKFMFESPHHDRTREILGGWVRM